MNNKKEHAIIQYILEQRKNGWKDGEIRAHMERWGYQTELLNNYFHHADRNMMKRQVLTFVVPLVVLLFTGFVFAKSDLTGAITWPWTTYDCGDDYPASARYVMDLSDCVSDSEETKQYIFCYMNTTTSPSTLSPDSANDDWYLNMLGVDFSLFSNTTNTVAVLGKAVVLPPNATSYDNVDCFRWTHGTTRSADWHQCNASTPPENLVFYFTDVLEENGLGVGGLGSELYYNSSYALCYDELQCTTNTSSCDEDNGYYCVGRLDSTSGSAWYPCDTTQSASYYRCCKGGCEGIEMGCGELIELPDGSVTSFTECSSDGTSGCCSAMTDCVYDSECYSEDETITSIGGSLGVGSGMFGGGIEATMTEYTFVCSDSHWCPKGFEYDASLFTCVAAKAMCYDATDTDYCNYIFGTDDIDVWEADTEGSKAGCIKPDPDGDTTIAYNESCVYSGTYGDADFYFYEDITWY